LSLAVLAAILTIIGYSVDTDILLTSEILKSGGRKNIKENIDRAMKTGLTLTATTLVALLSIYLFSGSVVLQQIAFVLMIGLLVDLPATWWTNAGLLRWWLEREDAKKS
jgi:preprotein translocase subunit SecF